MFKEYLNNFILKMDSIKIIEDAIEENVTSKVNEEVNKYKDALSIEIYFDQLVNDKVDVKLEEYVKTFIEIVESNKDEKQITYKFLNKNDNLNQYKNIEKARKVLITGFNTLFNMYNNTLISILIEFENLVGRLFEDIIKRVPEAYLKKLTISYSDIIKAPDISNIKSKIISKEVDSIMRQNIFEWIKIFEEKHDIKILLENEYVKNFIEAYYRRNIIVHNNGRINIDYINGIKKINNSISEKDIGRKKICDKKYIDKIIDSTIYFVIYIMSQLLKVFEEENDEFNDEILNMGYEKLKNEKYLMAREIFNLLIKNKKINNQMKMYSLINYWQTFKWNDEFDKIENELKAFDVSAYDIDIKLAVYALREEYEWIKNILKEEFNEEKQNKQLALELEEYPVFKELRKQEFYKILKGKYIEIFSIKSTSVNEENSTKINDVVEKKSGKFRIKLDIG